MKIGEILIAKGAIGREDLGEPWKYNVRPVDAWAPFWSEWGLYLKMRY